MPQLDIILNDEEKFIIMDLIFSKGGKLIVDKNYDVPIYEKLSNMDEYLRYMAINSERNSLFFIINETYSKYEMEFGFFVKNDQQKFFIKQRYGGPSIDFFSGSIKNAGLIATSFIACYSSYYIEDKEIYTPAELKAFYNLITSHIKKMAKKVKLKNRSYYIGLDTIEKIKSGDIVIANISGDDLNEMIL